MNDTPTFPPDVSAVLHSKRPQIVMLLATARYLAEQQSPEHDTLWSARLHSIKAAIICGELPAITDAPGRCNVHANIALSDLIEFCDRRGEEPEFRGWLAELVNAWRSAYMQAGGSLSGGPIVTTPDPKPALRADVDEVVRNYCATCSTRRSIDDHWRCIQKLPGMGGLGRGRCRKLLKEHGDKVIFRERGNPRTAEI